MVSSATTAGKLPRRAIFALVRIRNIIAYQVVIVNCTLSPIYHSRFRSLARGPHWRKDPSLLASYRPNVGLGNVTFPSLSPLCSVGEISDTRNTMSAPLHKRIAWSHDRIACMSVSPLLWGCNCYGADRLEPPSFGLGADCLGAESLEVQRLGLDLPTEERPSFETKQIHR